MLQVSTLGAHMCGGGINLMRAYWRNTVSGRHGSSFVMGGNWWRTVLIAL